MRSTEVRAIGELAGRTLAGGGAMVRDLHMAVADRAFTAVGPGGAPARVIHDGVAEALYGGVRTGPRGAPARRPARPSRARRAQQAPALAQSPRGSLALAALNAYVGDALAATGSELALAMTLRHRGADLPLDPDGLARRCPTRGPRVAIFVHGLGETDASWRLRADAQRPGYGARLQRDLGHTPIELRYNTGLHISENGRALAELLEELLERMAGGDRGDRRSSGTRWAASSRAAPATTASASGHGWMRAVRHVFCLGSPHLGAPLEKGGQRRWAGRCVACPRRGPLADSSTRAAPGSRTCATASCAEEDWCDCDPDELLTDRCRDVPFLPGARFYFVAATLSRRPERTRWAPSSATCSCASPAPRARAGARRSASPSRTATTSAA